jgi:acid phosphatase type 7
MASRFLPAILALWLSVPGPPALAAAADEPPKFEVPAPAPGKPLTFVVYGDTRFTQRPDVVNTDARRALVDKIATESPAAVLIGGDLVFQGSDPDDYEVFRKETAIWARQGVAIFPALGNHEFRGCDDNQDPCLDNWWKAFGDPALRGHRWYSVDIGDSVLALVLDTDSSLKARSAQRTWLERALTHADERVRFILILLHYPPVRDPVYPRVRDEKEVARLLARKAKSLHARVVVIGSHVHNYERYSRDGVTYLVSGGGGAKPVPAFRFFGELSKLKTTVNFHYLRFTVEGGLLKATMVRFDAADPAGTPWSEPDHFEVEAQE